MKKVFCILAASILMPKAVFAQSEKTEETFKRHNVMVAIGHMLVGQGVNEDGSRSALSVPVWMIDYDFSLSRKWTLGVHTDLITENYKVEGYFFEPETKVIEREHPKAIALAGGFKPGKRSVFTFGAGGEFSKGANYFLTVVGWEYAIELPGEWELSPSVTYDLKWSAYDSFSLALGVRKKL